MTFRQLLMILTAGLLLAASLDSAAAAPNDRAACREETKDSDAAIAACSRLIAARALQGPPLANAYRVRGEHYRFKKEYERAIQDLSEAIRLNPKDAQAYFDRGFVYKLQDDCERAIADFSAVIELDKTKDHAHYFRASCYSEKRDYDRAIAGYSEAIQLDPKDVHARRGLVHAFTMRALSHERNGRIDQALVDYRGALAVAPDDQSAREGATRLEAKKAAAANPAPAASTAATQTAAGPAGDRDACQGTPPEAIDACSRLIAAGTLQGAELAEIYLSRGSIYLLYNIDAERALADINEAIRLDPTRYQAYFLRAFSYGWRQEHDRAIAELNEAIRLAPQDDEGWLWRAMVYLYHKQDYDRAMADVDAGIAVSGRRTLLYALRGRIHDKKGASAQAAADRQRALELGKETVEQFDRFEQQFATTGNAYLAFLNVFFGTPLTPSTTAPPSRAAAATPAADDLSDCRAATKDADAMLAACSRVIEAGKVQDSELSAAHFGRGVALRRKGEFERAIAEYNEAIRLAPEPPLGNLGRGAVFVDLGQPERAIADWDAAISYYDKLIANSPDSAQWPYFNRAHLYLNKGALDRAIADYGESIRVPPANALFYSSRARAYRLKGDVAKAHADATQAISLPGNSALGQAWGHTERGLAYELAGQLDDALTDHETAIKLDPTLGWAYANRGRVRDAKGERERAAADFAAALQHDPSVAWTYVFFGSVLEQAGNLERALIEYEFALKLDPKALSAIRGRERVRAALGTNPAQK